MKQCIRCGEVKDESAFALNRYGDKTYRRNVCRVCYKASLPNHEADKKPEGRNCTQCGAYKPLSEFHKHKATLYGVEPMCKVCRLRKRREYNRQYPERVRNSDLKEKYGITLDDYHELLARQQAKCAICGNAETPLKVDHNHRTGKVRGLLCHLCNAMIGCAREDIEILASAAAYLYAEAHPEAVPVRARIAIEG